MPELPEVETIKRSLLSELVGTNIENVLIFYSGMLQNIDSASFVEQTVGSTISDVSRKGKYLLVKLNAQSSTNNVMIIHLRMTGRLVVTKNDRKKYRHPIDTVPVELRHLRCVFFTNSGLNLEFHDQRRFGTIALVEEGKERFWKGLGKLGPEPLSETFDCDDFYHGLIKSSSSIKGILLNQKLVAGLGNIYADEALHLSGIHPDRAGNSLDRDEVEKLYKAIREVISRGIEYRGTTFSDYRDLKGNKGQYQSLLNVYNKNKHPCAYCGYIIKKIKVCGRGTYYCPGCQPYD